MLCGTCLQLLRSYSVFQLPPGAAILCSTEDLRLVPLPHWNLNDPSTDTFVTTSFSGYDPHTGDYFAALGATGVLASISQDLQTAPGTTYTLDYFLASDGLTPNEFRVVWNGATLFDEVNIGPQDYTKYSFHVTATGTSTNLTFFEENDNGFLSLDDVSVNALSASAVPEPVSLMLLGIGVAGIVVYRLRKWN